MKKTSMLLIMILIVGSTLLWGAGSAEEGSSEEKVTLTVWTFVDPSGEDVRGQAHRHVHETFMEKYPNIELDVNVVNWQQLDSMLIRAAAGGKSPDVSMIYHPSLLMHAEAGSIQSLNPYLSEGLLDGKDDFVAPWGITEIDGEKMGFHYEHRVTGLMYREDILEERGFEYPTSMKNLISQAKKVHNPPELFSFLSCVNSRNPMTVMERAMPLVYSEGGVLINSDGTAAVNSEAWVKVVEFWRDLVHEYEIFPQNIALSHTDETQNLFIGGNGLYYSQPSHRLAFTRDRTDPENKIGFGPIPAFNENETAPVAIFGWIQVLPKNSNHPEEAAKYIEHFISPEMQAHLSQQAKYIPVRQSVLDYPWFDTDEASDIRNFVELASANPLEPLVLPEHSTELFTMVGEVFEKAILNPEMSVKSELDKVASDYNSRYVSK